MDFSMTCRTCLSIKGLNPIFLNPENYKRYSSALLMVAGVKVEMNDGLPQKMCTNCIIILNNSLKFRKQCKEVEIQLLQLMKQHEHAENGLEFKDKGLDLSREHVYDTDVALHTELIKDEGLDLSREYVYEPDVTLHTELIKDESSDLSSEYANESDVTLHTELKLNSEIKEENVVGEFSEDNEDDDDKPLKYYVHDPSSLSDSQTTDDSLNNTKETKDVIEQISEVSIPEIEAEKRKCMLKDELMNKEPPYQEMFSADAKKQRVTCKMCLKDLSIRSIDTHMARMHPGADERKVKCELCDKYVFAAKLRRHVRMAHGDRGHRCGYCKTEFGSREALVDHVGSCGAKKKKRKTNEAGRQLQECDVCHKTMQRASLRMHKAIKHAGLGPVCEHCGKKFGNKFRLNEHYRAKHGYEKFRCSYCDFRSAGIVSMRNHERRHRGEKPFVCDACGAKFHAAYLLAQHKQSHRAERLVKCDRCPARFKARNSLHAHRLAPARAQYTSD